MWTAVRPRVYAGSERVMQCGLHLSRSFGHQMLQSHTWTISTTDILSGQQCGSVVSCCYLCLNKELSDSFRTKKKYGYGSEILACRRESSWMLN